MTSQFSNRATICALLIALAAPAAAESNSANSTNLKSKQAFKALKPIAEEGKAAAQHELGVMYRTGKGAPQNYKLAAKWFRKAADQGMSEAQNNLGGLYATGQGVEKDYVQAYKWFSLSASRGLAEGKSNRDKLAKEMTAAQIAKGKKLSEKWAPIDPDPGKMQRRPLPDHVPDPVRP